MPRTPRVIFKEQVYEVVIRAKEGLPFPPTRTSNAIIEGVMARTQRDDKVDLSNYCWMTNHSHFLALSRKAQQFTNFYGETQKKTTDALRALLGQKCLSLWEGRATTMLLAELQDVIERLVYVFTNPASAGLCDSIDEYPGPSSWKAFCTCEPHVDAEVVNKVHWYPVASIPKLPPNRVLTPDQDLAMVEMMAASPKKVEHDLVVKPLIWLKPFGITNPEEIEAIRQGIIAAVREKEAALRLQRQNEDKRTIGAPALRRQPYMKPHTPKKKERKIFLICRNSKRRGELIGIFRSIIQRCRDSYEQLKQGCKDVLWPDGTFIPWLPPRECCSLE